VVPEALAPRYAPDGGSAFRLERPDFPRLLEALARRGYRVVGPTVREGAIVYDEIRSESDLPVGWTDRQEAGRYRLERRPDEALFGYAVGPHSWKKYLFRPHERLFRAERTADGAFRVEPEPDGSEPVAFLGVRACEIAALEVQDRVFSGPHADPSYRARRAAALTIAVECAQAGGTCFCVSMRTGPRVTGGADLVLLEVVGPGEHFFLLRAGSDAGALVLSDLPVRPAGSSERERREATLERTAATMGRRLEEAGIREVLLERPEHPRWELVARRCLSCTNCTLVCPTCFCSTTEEVPSLDGERSERWRRWDSCFNLGFSEVHGGGSVRKSGRSRYRQWLTHKLASWYDQFGRSGCVGCGRCITWCPVGIDLTEEATAIRTLAPAGPEARP
jgi:sulfhydrogenase subunit beta (sulfur reductase)